MPSWIHDRAEHIRAKNPGMPESESWAIATQQSHATGHSPKGYGTAQGRSEAKAKYRTPGDDVQTANPQESSGKSKTAHLLPFLDGFSDELSKIAGALQGTPSTVSEIKSTIPRNTMKMSTPKYSKINPDSPGSPASQLQPVLSPPPVRG